jgi:hypothetical protein
MFPQSIRYGDISLKFGAWNKKNPFPIEEVTEKAMKVLRKSRWRDNSKTAGTNG